jgi:hypothetical protein
MPLTRALCAAAALCAFACDSTETGLAPVGGDRPSQAEIERFARRLHLDLIGSPPGDAFVADAVAQLTAANTADVRRGLAQGLIDDPGFAQLYVEEIENRTFGGETAETRYDLLCGIIRGDDPACASCGFPEDGDFCGGCACPSLSSLYAEREALFEAAADLDGGESTASVERRFVDTQPFLAFSTPEGVADLLFEGLLGHLPQDEEQRNAAAMVTGALIPGSPAGILFHRHGASYDDLLDILFESAVYREAMVSAVFERYLGRLPSAPELGHFAATLDAVDPDARALIVEVVASREYFEQ